MFIALTEGTAVVSHIFMVVQQQWGEHLTLVSNDVLEFEDSPGCKGTLLIYVMRKPLYICYSLCRRTVSCLHGLSHCPLDLITLV